MKTPSTGDAAAPDKRDEAVESPKPQGRSKTTSNVDGQAAPRTPTERDESSDSGSRPPSDVMQRAHDDVVSGKKGTDKGEGTDAVYGRNLRNRTPGSERD